MHCDGCMKIGRRRHTVREKLSMRPCTTVCSRAEETVRPRFSTSTMLTEPLCLTCAWLEITVSEPVPPVLHRRLLAWRRRRFNKDVDA
jgi:hypothetical protein